MISPPPRLKISEWCEAHAYLPAEGNAEPGKYHGSRMPWQPDMLNDPLDTTVEECAWMLASQLGKTMCLIFIISYFVSQMPSKILMVYPKLQDVLDWMRDKFIPTTRDMPIMEGLLKEPRQKDSGSQALNRKFPGGGLVGVGSISTSSLRRVSARCVIQDEIDDFEITPQGDSMALADKRAETFHNAVKLKSSTPTHKGASRIEALLEKSDQQRFFVPCQFCGHMQHLQWKQFKFSFADADGQMITNTEAALYECEECKAPWTDQDRMAAIYDPRSAWRATAPATKIRGRHLNGLYRVIGKKTAYRSYHHEFAEAFLKAKSGGRETMMVWVNTFLAETWADPTKEIAWEPLMKRAEEYGPDLTDEVALLVAGADVHPDRIELSVIGFGDEEECWWVENHVVWGDFDLPHVQTQVDDFLVRTWKHPNGARLAVTAVGMDSGHKTKAVYKFCRERMARRIWPVRGSGTPYAPLVTPSTKRHYGLTLFMVGTDTAKDAIFSRLEIADPGPRYVHFPKPTIRIATPEGGQRLHRTGFDEKFYRQLCSEKIVEVVSRGVTVRKYIQTQTRNEVLDKFVYALAAYDILRPNVERVRESVERIVGAEKAAQNVPRGTIQPAEGVIMQKPAAYRPEVRKSEQKPKYSGGMFNPLGL